MNAAINTSFLRIVLSLNRAKKFQSMLAGGLFALLNIAVTMSANAAPIIVDISITGIINGSTLSGSGTATKDTVTGITLASIEFASIPNSFDVVAYGKSWSTKHHPAHPVNLNGAEGFGSLSPSGYNFSTTISYDGGLGTLISSGSYTASALPGIDYTYNLDIQGFYAGPLGAVGIVTSPALFSNDIGAPGSIHMHDVETILYSDGSTLGLTEVGTFILNSGAVLPLDRQFLTVDIISAGFDTASSILTLNTRSTFAVPSPSTLSLSLLSLLVLMLRRTNVSGSAGVAA